MLAKWAEYRHNLHGYSFLTVFTILKHWSCYSTTTNCYFWTELCHFDS